MISKGIPSLPQNGTETFRVKDLYMINCRDKMDGNIGVGGWNLAFFKMGYCKTRQFTTSFPYNSFGSALFHPFAWVMEYTVLYLAW